MSEAMKSAREQYEETLNRRVVAQQYRDQAEMYRQQEAMNLGVVTFSPKVMTGVFIVCVIVGFIVILSQ